MIQRIPTLLLPPLLLGATVAPAHAQDPSAVAERIAAARPLAEGVLVLRGHFVNDDLRDPANIRFDARGRMHADYGGLILRDMAFDGEGAWSVDGAGRPYDMHGMHRDMQITFHGLLCGNWLAALEWDLEPTGAGKVRARLIGGHVDMEVELDDRDLPERVEVDTFGRMQGLRFSDWRENELGRWPGRVEFRDGPRLVATFEYEELARSDAAGFGPPEDAGLDVRFDSDADPELDVRIVGSGHTFVRVEMNGEDVGWMSFDTGAGRSMLDARVAKRLGLETLIDGLRSTGAGGATPITVRRADTLRVGPLTWHEPVLAAADISALERSFGVRPLAGLLGADLLAHAVWEYDLAGPRIVAHPPGAGPDDATWVPVYIEEGQLLAPVSFEGHEGRFAVDTGGGSAMYFNAPTVERFNLLEGRNTRATSVRGVGGLVSVRQGPIGEVVFAGRSFEGLRATFTSCDVPGAWCDPYSDGVAGIALLRRGPVWFDYPGRRIGVTDAR